MQVLFQRARDVNHDIYVRFVGYRKAFDNVQHDKLVEMLKFIDIEEVDIRMISDL